MSEFASMPANLNADELRQAFMAFNDMSKQLSDSYEQLENRVVQLSGELATASRQRLQELAEKERLADRLESLLQMLPAGVLLLDQYGVVKQSNQAADDILLPMLSVSDLVGQRWRELIKSCFKPRQDDGHEISLVDGRRVQLSTAPMSNEPGQLILLTDMTETRELQARLSHHERLSAMGKMVASLAHQVRTPLATATLYAGHLATPQLDESMRLRFAGKLQERLRHLENQIRDMLIFARGEMPLENTISLAELEIELKAAMEPVLDNHHAQYQVFNYQPAARLLCNKDVLVSALMNLVNNAIEAAVVGQASVVISFDAQQGQVFITLADNGSGLDDGEKEKILQPFYTTKPSGTGLGLAVVQAVARSHKAEFVLTDNPEGGLIAGLVLPQAHDPEEE